MHFQPIQGKSLDIIDAVLRTEEVASLGKALGIIRLVTEELVVNIVNYAYADATDGLPTATDYLDVEIQRDADSITLRFRDGGVPFNPLAREVPDTSLPLEKRRIGGLGIFMVVEMMDSVSYEYTNGENVLTAGLKIKDEND